MTLLDRCWIGILLLLLLEPRIKDMSWFDAVVFFLAMLFCLWSTWESRKKEYSDGKEKR